MAETLLPPPQSEKQRAIEALSLSDLPNYRFMGVYYLQNTASGKLYVGSSQDVFKRIGSHLNMLQNGRHSNVHLQRSFDKHGLNNLVWGVCEEVFDVEQLLRVEQEWIDIIGDYNICTEAGSTRGYKASEETRAKLSAMFSGENNPMYGTKRPEIGELMRKVHTGKTLTDEHKQKCSEALKGHRGPWDNPESAKKIVEAARAANTGRKHSAETRAKLSAASRGHVKSEETREKLRIANTGRKHTEETKALIGDMKRGKPLQLSEEDIEKRTARLHAHLASLTDEQKAERRKMLADNVIARCTGVPLSDEHKAKLSATTKGRSLSESHLANMRKAAKNRAPWSEERKLAHAAQLQRINAAAATRTPEQKAASQVKRLETTRRNKELKISV